MDISTTGNVSERYFERNPDVQRTLSMKVDAIPRSELYLDETFNYRDFEAFHSSIVDYLL